MVFETGKRYNTAFSMAFEVDHDNEDCSDLTAQDFIRAVLRKLENNMIYGESIRDVLEPSDTMENPDYDPINDIIKESETTGEY